MSPGPHQWWHHVPVCAFGGACGEVELENIRALIIDLARTGFRAICVEPTPDVLGDEGRVLSDFIASIHRAGLKVIVRIPLDPSALLGRPCASAPLVAAAGAALACGADGIDIGVVDAPGPTRTSEGDGRLSQMIKDLHTDIALSHPQAILTAETLSADVALIDHHLTEHWFHHLRDGALLFAQWDGQDLRRRVTAVLQHRDALGHVANWHWSYSQDVHEEAARASYLPWRQEHAAMRGSALALFSLSLPGSASVLFRHMGGRIVDSGGQKRRVWQADRQASAEAAAMRTVLRVREERAMGTGSLAWVDNLPWAHAGVSVHLSGGVTVVLNMSDAPVCVPAQHVLLVSSDPEVEVSAAGTVVEPNSCAWFDTARVRPETVTFGD